MRHIFKTSITPKYQHGITLTLHAQTNKSHWNTALDKAWTARPLTDVTATHSRKVNSEDNILTLSTVRSMRQARHTLACTQQFSTVADRLFWADLAGSASTEL